VAGSKFSIVSYKESDLENAAVLLLDSYPGERFFALYGEMGAGKTTFIKAICEKLNVTDVVSSPTFSIVNIYRTKDLEEVYHFDLYRINSLEEVFDIGYEDYFFSQSYCFVEWPEKIENLLPENAIKIFIEVRQSGENRVIKF
jgi:tRNA threonylcarbamoyladenosine biosynthesis protein TsaE